MLEAHEASLGAGVRNQILLFHVLYSGDFFVLYTTKRRQKPGYVGLNYESKPYNTRLVRERKCRDYSPHSTASNVVSVIPAVSFAGKLKLQTYTCLVVYHEILGGLSS